MTFSKLSNYLVIFEMTNAFGVKLIKRLNHPSSTGHAFLFCFVSLRMTGHVPHPAPLNEDVTPSSCQTDRGPGTRL